MILYCSGIPVTPASIDFGDLSTKDQINALSAFSQMVNAISSSSESWTPGGSLTWNIYQNVLTMSEFAQGAKSTAPAASPPETTATLHQRLSPWMKAWGFQFGDRPTGASAPAAAPAAPVPPPGPLSTAFSQLAATLAIDVLTDTLDRPFYPTYVYPPDFGEAVNDALWIPFQLTPGQTDPWLPVGANETISGEMITLPLQRAWWSPWVFESRAWRFGAAYGLPALSDGGSPPQGSMPMYASAVTIARNLKIVGDYTTVAKLTLKTADAGATVDAAAMNIIAFCCTALPQSPNPDPSLSW